MNLGLIPKFSNIFPKEPIPDLTDLLNETPSRLSIGILSYINGSLFLKDDSETQLHFIKQLVGRCETEIVYRVLLNLKAFNNDHNIDYINVFPLYTVLKFLEWEIIHYRDIQFTESTAEQELNIFKAILIFNEKLDEIHRTIKFHRENPFELFWTVGLSQIEFSSRKFFLVKVPSSLELFEYLETKYPKYYSEYLSFLNVKDTVSIFRNIIEFFINGYKKDDRLYRTNFNTEILSKNRILRSIVLDISKLDRQEYTQNKFDKYFKGLRKWPLIQHDSNTFDVMNWNFVSDKLSSIAIVFDFYLNTRISERLRFEDLRSEIGTQFSEKTVFNRTIKEAFSSPKFIHITPEENKNINVDYYLRNGNHISLIEYKDYIVPDRVKYGSYDEIKQYFDQRFIKSEKGQEKGVLQLINQIESLNRVPLQFEDFNAKGITISRLFIYPIIIVNDESFNIPGFESYLNSVFRSSIGDRKFSFSCIYNLTVIDLDFLLENSHIFQDQNITLNSLIHRHYLELEARKVIFRRFQNPKTHIECFESFKHTTSPKLPHLDPTETPIFRSVADKLRFPQK